MYAIIEDGAHQYKVAAGDRLDVQLRDLPEGQTEIRFDKVLFVGDDGSHRIGQPYVEGAAVTATVEDTIKGDKISIVKYRRRKNSKTKKGHRQQYLRVRINAIEA